MTYKELQNKHQCSFNIGGCYAYRELCTRITALAYSLTGRKVETPTNKLAVAKGTIVEAATMLGFTCEGEFTMAQYNSAHEYLGNYIINKAIEQ